MRISSGYAKGMEIKSPEGLVTRPTSEKVRAAMLNSIQSELEGAAILDLYSGTGALGLEALSRGSSSCWFVDQSKESCKVLKTNLTEFFRRLKIQGMALPDTQVSLSGVEAFLKRGQAAGMYFNLVFADPPYARFVMEAEALLLMLPQVLTSDALVILESDASGERPLLEMLERHRAWQMLRNKNYGNTRLYTLCYNGRDTQKDSLP